MVRGAMMKEATPKAVFEGRRPDPAASFSQRLDAGRRSVRRRAQPRHEEAVEAARVGEQAGRSDEHTSELQSLMRISYAVFCLYKKYGQRRRQPHARSAPFPK